MADEQRTLTANFTADSSGFAAGADEVKKKLTELNTALTQNKQAIKETNSEITKNRKEYDQLQKQIKESGEATEEQEQRLQELNDEYAQLSAKMGSLKTAETTLKQQIKSTTGEMSNQKSATDKLKKSASDLGKELASAAAVIGAASAAIFGLTAKYGAWADDMNTLSVQTGLSTEELQKFSIAAGVCDVELSDVTGSITKLKNNMQLARDGSAQLVSTFDALGVSFSNADGSLRDATTVFYEIVEAMGGIENATERDAYAMDLFGRSATQLNTLLVDGGTSFREYSDSMSKYVLPQETLDRLNSFNDQLDTLKARGNSVAAMVGAEFSEAFDGAFDAGDKFFDMIEESIENGGFAEFAEELADGVVAVGEAVANTVGFLWEHKEAVLAGAVAMGTFKAAISIGNIISGTVIAIKSFKTATDAATASQKLFNAAGAANPYVLIASLAASAVAALVTFSVATGDVQTEVDKLIEKSKELDDAYEESIKSGEAEIAMLKRKVDRYEELRQKTEKTAAEQNELKGIADDLQNTFGDEIKVVDELTGTYNDLTDAVEGYIQKQRKEFELQALKTKAEESQRLILDVDEEIESYRKDIEQSKQNSENRESSWLDNYFATPDDMVQGLENQIKESEDLKAELQKNIDAYFDALGESYSTGTTITTGVAPQTPAGSAMAEHERAKGIARLSRQEQLQTMSAEELAQLQEQYKAEKQLADDLYSVREISDAEYYSRLEALRDEYLKSNTHEWYTATSELMKLMDKTGDSLADPIKETFDGISDAYKKLLDDIDRELEKHNRELEDTEYTEKIQAVTARLAYEKLDTFSRKELEKELADLNAEWGEVKYQRGAEDKRDILNQVYTQSQAMMETAPSGVSTAQWNAAVNAAFDTISNSVMTGKTTQAPAANKVYNIVVQGANKTTEQIVREVTAAIASGAI